MRSFPDGILDAFAAAFGATVGMLCAVKLFAWLFW